MTALVRTFAAPVAILSLAATNVFAAPSDARDAVVLVVVNGVNVNQGNAPAAVQGTGFFISRDGYLVTAYHLLTKLQEAGVDPQTVSYEIHLSPLSTVKASAQPLFVNPAADLMVLYAPVGGLNVKTLKPANRQNATVVEGKTTIYSAGYPSGAGFTVAPGVIKSFDGLLDAQPAWSSTLTFKEGESGSPILLEDGRVIAVAKGIDKDSVTTGYVVPSRLIPGEYWDTAVIMATAPSVSIADSGRILIETTATQPVLRTEPVKLALPNCSQPSVQTRTIYAKPGWKIVPGSVADPVVTISVGANSALRIDQKTSDAITVSAKLASLGQCVGVFGNTLTTDIPAKLQAQIAFNEVPDPSAKQWVAISNVSLAKAVKAPLPQVAPEDLRYSIVSPSGEKIAFKPIQSEIARVGSSNSLDIGKLTARLQGVATTSAATGAARPPKL